MEFKVKQLLSREKVSPDKLKDWADISQQKYHSSADRGRGMLSTEEMSFFPTLTTLYSREVQCVWGVGGGRGHGAGQYDHTMSQPLRHLCTDRPSLSWERRRGHREGPAGLRRRGWLRAAMLAKWGNTS